MTLEIKTSNEIISSDEQYSWISKNYSVFLSKKWVSTESLIERLEKMIKDETGEYLDYMDDVDVDYVKDLIKELRGGK